MQGNVPLTHSAEVGHIPDLIVLDIIQYAPDWEIVYFLEQHGTTYDMIVVGIFFFLNINAKDLIFHIPCVSNLIKIAFAPY